MINKVTDETFKVEVLKSDKPVFVDFMADWCGPCKAMSSTVEKIADSYKDKVKVVKIDIEDAPNTAAQFGIRGVPTFILFKNGEKIHQWVGANSNKKIFTEKFDEILLDE